MDYIKSRLTTRSSERTISPLSKAVIYLIIFICVFAGATSITVWRSKNQPDLTWADTTQLPPVKPAPAMISSEAPESSEAYIEPFACRGHADYAINKIEQIFRESSTFRNVRRVGNQLQAVAITPLLGFEDDLVLQARYNPDRIEIFSASRVGVGDFGANRKRLESLRDQLRELMVVQ